MFVHAGARNQLLARRRARFVDEHVAPGGAGGHRLGVPLDDVVAAVRSLMAPRSTGPTRCRPHPSALPPPLHRPRPTDGATRP